MNLRTQHLLSCAILLLLVACNPTPPKSSAPNLLLITLDTTRSDHLSAYGYERQTTPNIDAIAKAGLLFTRLRAPIPLTTPSHASLFTGLSPVEHKVRANYGSADRLSDHYITLAEHLTNKGYETAASVGAFTAGSAGGLNQGFTSFFEPDYEKAPERPASEVVQDALKWLEDKRGGPYFLWVHVFDAHGPYLAHREALAALSPSPELKAAPAPGQHRSPEADILHYDGELRYIDGQLALLFGHPRVANDNTLIAIFGDHGEGLTERQMGFQHGSYVYEEQLAIPGILKGPGLQAGSRYEALTTLEHMAPTLLELLGQGALKAQRMPSLVNQLTATPVTPSAQDQLSEKDLQSLAFAESMPCTHGRAMTCAPEGVTAKLRAITAGRWKLIFTPHPSAPKYELYRLDTDPGERTNLAQSRPKIVNTLLGLLNAHFAAN